MKKIEFRKAEKYFYNETKSAEASGMKPNQTNKTEYLERRRIEDLRVALVHEYLTLLGGSERMLLDFLDIFPQSDLFLLTYNPKKLPKEFISKIEKHKIIVSNLKKIQRFTSLVRMWAQQATEQFDFSGYDLVFSNCSYCSKGVLVPQDTISISYIQSPTRYLWDYTHNYLKEHAKNNLAKRFLHKLFFKQRKWDFLAAQRPDLLLANSKNVKNRIKKYYRRNSLVLYPSINVSNFKFSPKKDDFFLIVSRLSPYKKVDLVIQTFKNLPNLKLKVVGEGVDKKKLQNLAKGAKNIEFLGFVDDERLKNLYSRALAVLFPQVEDFGLVPLEAAASGTPTIAFKEGGALETVIESETGLFFKEQTESSLAKTIKEFLNRKFDPYEIKKQVQRFDKSQFRQKLIEIVENEINTKK